MRHGRSFVDRNRAVVVDVRNDERSIGYQTSIRAKLLWYSNHDPIEKRRVQLPARSEVRYAVQRERL